MPTLDTSVDAWLGTTTLTTTADALLQATVTLTMTVDGYVVRPLWTQADAFITEARGTFRGTMTTAERDVLELVQPGDVVLVTDAT